MPTPKPNPRPQRLPARQPYAGNPIKRRLKELHRTQGWLAIQMRVSPSSVANYVSGRVPLYPDDLRTRDLCIALKTTYGQLFWGRKKED